MPLYIAKSGDLDRCHRCLTDSQSKDSATQLLTKYKIGALVTQLCQGAGNLSEGGEYQAKSIAKGIRCLNAINRSFINVDFNIDIKINTNSRITNIDTTTTKV